tara:strand:- start:245 stop:445 length:201 start_codon:yes stop_codon:yes gene_type:complete
MNLCVFAIGNLALDVGIIFFLAFSDIGFLLSSNLYFKIKGLKFVNQIGNTAKATIITKVNFGDLII